MASGSNSMEPWSELNNKVVLVTGASSGLGWQLCLELAKAGCRVIAAARRIERLRSLCDQINGQISFSGSNNSSRDQPRAAAFELDVSASEPIIEARVKEAWAIFGRIDALINNAGIRERIHGPLDLTEEEWNNVITTNQTGLYLMSKHVSMHMRDSKQGGGGSIVNLSSISGLDRVQFHGGHAYSASKYAVNSITKVMAMELGAYNIRVNSIVPAVFESQITDGLVKRGSHKRLNASLPLPAEGSIIPGLTSVARYLIHDDSQYVTGNIFIVDGGLTLCGLPLYLSLSAL